MRDYSSRALEKLFIFISERVQFVALSVEHSDNMLMLVLHRDDNLRPRGVKRRQVALIFRNVADDNRFARLERSAAQALGSWKTRIGRRLVANAGTDDKLILHNLINRDELVIARCADHLRNLLDAFLGAPAR